eukprot:COSAG04_NODE_1687_length_5942_cov_5.827144_2_plen_127_part_00
MLIQGVHPGLAGQAQIADSIWAWLKYRASLEAESAGSEPGQTTAGSATPPPASKSPWIDTSDGIHLFSLWGRGKDGPAGGWGRGKNSRAEYVWGAEKSADWHADDPGTVVSHYIPCKRTDITETHF